MTTDDRPVRYAVLRDRQNWDESATRLGLQPQPDGTLTLARLPGTADGTLIAEVVPLEVPPSGLAVDDCQDVYLANTAGRRVVWAAGPGSDRVILGGDGALGQFQSPRGLLIANGALYVADSLNKRIQVLRLPSLELRAIWEETLTDPVALASDRQGRLYVLDCGINSVLRFSAGGTPDNGYNASLALALGGHVPVGLAVDDQGRLYLAERGSNQMLRFDATGQAPPALTGSAPQRPGTMAARGNRLYVADAAGGQIWACDCAAAAFLGALPDYRGPVTALAIDKAGALYIKPGLDETYYQLAPDVTYAPQGSLTGGPFDAGEQGVWERAHAALDLPAGSNAELHLFVAGAEAPGPAASDWLPAESLDTLIATVTGPGRFLWLQLILQAGERQRSSPLLRQVQAETTAESYLNYLPAVYQRDDAPSRFLERWLALFRSELGDLEQTLEDMPRRFDPLSAPEADLRWLATWLAFEPPQDITGAELRALLQRVPALNDWRGTPFGVRQFVEL